MLGSFPFGRGALAATVRGRSDWITGARRMKYVVLAIVALLIPSPVYSFQDPPARPVVLVNARIHTVAGPVIDGGTILVENGRIKAVGKSVSMPSDAKVIDLAGKSVIPGLVDCSSGLFLAADGGSQGGSAEHDVCDALDFFDDTPPREALASGVTTVFVSPPGRGPFIGQAAVVRVSKAESPERIYKRSAALKASLGVATGDTTTATQRYRDYVALKEAFDGAVKYREGWEKYRKEFEEYEKKKKEWDAKKKAAPKKDEPKAEEPKKEEPKKEEPKKEEPPKKDEKEPELMAAGQEPPKQAPPKSPAADEPKKPSKPRLDPRSEVLVRALDE